MSDDDAPWPCSRDAADPAVPDDFDWDFSRFRAMEAESKVHEDEAALRSRRLDVATDASRLRTVSLAFARAVAEARRRRALTQKQLAAAVSLDSSIVAGIEAGTALYRPFEVQRLRRFLDLPKGLK